ncbi:MAG: hypothetical protein AAFP90_09800 [Planctomycetota bacterium]
MTKDFDVFFTEQVSSSENGKPVGICTNGVMTWNFPGYPSDQSLVIIPYQSIDRIELARESRGWRIVTNTGLILASLVGGGFLCLVLGSVLSGEGQVGPVLALASFLGPFALLASLILPFRYFSTLGYYFKITVGKKSGSFYFEPSDWEKKGPRIKEILDLTNHKLHLL